MKLKPNKQTRQFIVTLSCGLLKILQPMYQEIHNPFDFFLLPWPIISCSSFCIFSNTCTYCIDRITPLHAPQLPREKWNKGLLFDKLKLKTKCLIQLVHQLRAKKFDLVLTYDD